MALDFDLTDEQRMLRKMVRNFAEEDIAPVAQELDDREEFSYRLTKRMGELGLFGPFVPRGTAEAMSVMSLTSSPWRRSHGSMDLTRPP